MSQEDGTPTQHDAPEEKRTVQGEQGEALAEETTTPETPKEASEESTPEPATEEETVSE